MTGLKSKAFALALCEFRRGVPNSNWLIPMWFCLQFPPPPPACKSGHTSLLRALSCCWQWKHCIIFTPSYYCLVHTYCWVHISLLSAVIHRCMSLLISSHGIVNNAHTSWTNKQCTQCTLTVLGNSRSLSEMWKPTDTEVQMRGHHWRLYHRRTG